jgi:hypothetical protein
MLPCGQKLTLGLLSTITHEVIPFYTYVLFPELLQYFTCIPEVLFCKGVQLCLQSLVLNLHVAAYVYSNITKLYMQQAKVIQNHENEKAKPNIANIRGLNLVAVTCMTVQVSSLP